MAKERNYRMNRFESRLSSDGQISLERTTLGAGEDLPGAAKDAVQKVNSGKGVAVGKRIATSLVAAFLLAFGMLAAPATSSARVAIGISVNFGPPPIPVYTQPPCPGPGFIWTPGYWAYAPDAGYYWVPGAWLPAPFVGALWTPGYWGFSGGLYMWHPGYWGTMVGFYGGIDYGFGYTGYGYHGGYWDHDRFFYNRAVNRIEGRRFDHVYYRREDVHPRGGRVSYYGGPHGVNVRPTREQMNAARYRRSGPVRQQVRQEQFAHSNPVRRASYNHGRPDFGPAREFRGAPARGNGFQRNTYQARAGGRPGNQGRGGPQWHGPAQQQQRGRGGQAWHGPAQQQERGRGGNGHGNQHGRGGRR